MSSWGRCERCGSLRLLCVKCGCCKKECCKCWEKPKLESQFTEAEVAHDQASDDVELMTTKWQEAKQETRDSLINALEALDVIFAALGMDESEKTVGNAAAWIAEARADSERHVAGLRLIEHLSPASHLGNVRPSGIEKGCAYCIAALALGLTADEITAADFDAAREES